MNPTFLLAALLFFAPAVYGCVVFQATYSESGCDQGTLYAGITDNGHSVCTMAGKRSEDLVFHFSCTNANTSAYFDSMSDGLMYTTNHGTWRIPALKQYGLDFMWTACAFGCSPNSAGCYVKTETSEACAPSPM